MSKIYSRYLVSIRMSFPVYILMIKTNLMDSKLLNRHVYLYNMLQSAKINFNVLPKQVCFNCRSCNLRICDLFLYMLSWGMLSWGIETISIMQRPTEGEKYTETFVGFIQCWIYCLVNLTHVWAKILHGHLGLPDLCCQVKSIGSEFLPKIECPLSQVRNL